MYVCLGLSLILGVSCLYLTAIFLPVYASRGWLVAAMHLALGAILLGNILFNYIMCITTSPGTTAIAVKEVSEHLMPGASLCYQTFCHCLQWFTYLRYRLLEGGNAYLAVCILQGYHLAAGANVRFCKSCRRAKPSLTHHCHICKL